MYGANLNARHFYVLRKVADGATGPGPAALAVHHLVTMGLLATDERGETVVTSLGKSALADYNRLVR